MIRVLMATTLAMTVAAAAASASPLDALRWNKRVLLVFAGDADPARRAQIAAVGSGAAERDLLVLDVPKSGAVDIGQSEQIDAEMLRRAYGVNADAPFTVILIGKDGGVKTRATSPLKARDLYGIIDAMPMRAQEMRKS